MKALLIRFFTWLLGLLQPVEPPVEPPVEEKPLWDSRMDRLGVKLSCDASLRYRLTHIWMTGDGQWDDAPAWARQFLAPEFTEAGGATHMFGRCLDASGNVLPKMFVLAWPDGSDSRQPEASGWANFFAPAKYDPATATGPYSLTAGNGETVTGGGQPYGGPHVSIFGVWKARW